MGSARGIEQEVTDGALHTRGPVMQQHLSTHKLWFAARPDSHPAIPFGS